MFLFLRAAECRLQILSHCFMKTAICCMPVNDCLCVPIKLAKIGSELDLLRSHNLLHCPLVYSSISSSLLNIVKSQLKFRFSLKLVGSDLILRAA